jgi:hypothetical protein
MPEDKNLTQNELKKYLSYDKNTSILIRLIGQIRWINKEAGWINDQGYRLINVKKSKYRAHRLAFLYVEGYLPEHEVDHINKIRDDNRWCNLRHTTHKCNLRNTKVQIDNKTGVTGVYLPKNGNLWIAAITVDSKRIHIGCFNKFSDAVMARWEAENKYNFIKCQSDSSAYNYLKGNGLL